MKSALALAVGCACALAAVHAQAQVSLSSAASIGGTNETLTLVYDFAQLQNLPDSAQLSLPGCEILRRPGMPPLPFHTARILLPFNARVTIVDASAEEEHFPLSGKLQFGGNQAITNARPEPSLRSDSKVSGLNRQALSISPRAQPRAELISVQRLLGRDIALVRLFPVRFSTDGQNLHVASKMKVTLTLALGAHAASTPSLPAYAREQIAGFVDNPGDLGQPAAGRPLGRAAPDSFCDYLLITKQNLAPSFSPLLRQKSKSGLAVRVETVEAIQAREPGRDLPEKIRNFIRFASTNWGVQFILLGGDVGTVPCRYAFVRMNEKAVDSLIPCDLYYACLDGSWNRDDDQRWGEPSDGEDGGDVDLLAEVVLGRAPVDTPEEAARFVQKSLLAEDRSRTAGFRILVAAEYLGRFGSNPEAQGGKVFDSLLQQFQHVAITRLDDRPHSSPQWGSSELLEALNQSPCLVLHHGHAESDRVLRLQRHELSSLTNSQPFFFYSAGCYAGRFDNDPYSPDAVAEELISRADHGAFGAIFNPRLGWFDPGEEAQFSGEFQLKFMEALSQNPAPALGAAHQASRHWMLAHVESSGRMPYRWCYYEVTLLGDPHVRLHFESASRRSSLAASGATNN